MVMLFGIKTEDLVLCKAVYIYQHFRILMCEHHEKAYYYAPSGYMVKFNQQAILQSTIECKGAKYNKIEGFNNENIESIFYKIYLRNINCKRANQACRHWCTEIDVTIEVYHRNNFVTGYLCQTDYPFQFHEEFYEFLRDFIKDNIGFGLERVQLYMCNQKGIWINNELLVRLYSIFNDGQLFVAID